MSAVPVPAVGDVLETVLVDDLTRTRIVQYAGASGDFNPLHTDPAYATAVAGFPDVFAHGMLTMGMTARVLTDRWGNDAVRHLGGRFVAQVWPGDTLTAQAEVVGVDGALVELAITTRNADGTVVLTGRGVVDLGAAEDVSGA